MLSSHALSLKVHSMASDGEGNTIVAAPGQRDSCVGARRRLRLALVGDGERGAGDGFAVPYLFPPPRDFTTGRFRLVSTSNGAPSDDDLVAAMRRGGPCATLATHQLAAASPRGVYQTQQHREEPLPATDEPPPGAVS